MNDLTMIERIARAISDAIGDDNDAIRDYHRRIAIAAIEAMREPTDAMLAAIRPGLVDTDEFIKRDWYKMIDAALK